MTVGNVEIALPENIALLLHSHVDVPWSLIVMQPDFGWQIVSVMANCVSVMTKMLHLYNFAIPCGGRRAWKTSQCVRATAGRRV